MKTFAHFLGQCIFLLATVIANGQAVSWELSSQPGNQDFNNPNIQIPGFANCVLQRGEGVDPATLAGTMNSIGWFDDNNPMTLLDAMNGDNYYEFEIESNNCLFFNSSSIKIVLRSSGSGPNTATLRCSSDGFTTNIGTVTVGTTATLFTFNETISPNSSSVTYRLYGYGGAANGGTPSPSGSMQIGPSFEEATDNDLELFAVTTFIDINAISNINVTSGDIVPAIALTANVPGATINWSRTSESIGLGATNGTGDIPSFTALNNTGLTVTTTFTVTGTIGTCTGPGKTFSITVEPIPTISPCDSLKALLTIQGQFLPSPLPTGCENNFYTQVIAFYLKKDTTLVTPFGSLIIPIDSLIIKGINNLPPGINFTGCNDPNCFYYPSDDDTTGCLSISGTPVNTYNDSIEIIIEYWLGVLGSPQALTDTVKIPLEINCNPTFVCDITGVSIPNSGSCNDNGSSNNASDDYYKADIKVNFINPPSSGTLRIKPGNPNVLDVVETPVSSLSGGTHTFIEVRLRATGAVVNLEIEFSDDNGCVQSVNAAAVNSCSVPPPVFASSCDSLKSLLTSQGQFVPFPLPDGCVNIPYTQIIAFRLKKDTTMNLGPFGVLTIPVDSAEITGINNLPSGISFIGCTQPGCKYYPPANDTMDCLTISGTPVNSFEDSIEVIIEYWLGVFGSPQVVTDTVKLPLEIKNCNGAAVCAITNVIIQNAGSCNGNGTGDPSDDYFEADVSVSFSNPPATGFLKIFDPDMVLGEVNVDVAALGTSPYMLTGVRFTADGGTTSVAAKFTDNLSCIGGIGTTITVQPCSVPPNCGISVNVTNPGTCNNNSSSDPTDDFFEADVSVSFSNPPLTGFLKILSLNMVLGEVNVDVSTLGTSPYNFTDVKFKADGATINIVAKFTDNLGCVGGIGSSISSGPCVGTPPVPTCPSISYVDCFDDIPAIDPSSVSETHNCSGNVNITHVSDVESNVICLNQKTITRTYKVSDQCGNSTNCVQTIVVTDDEKPTISQKTDITKCGGSQAVQYTLPTATDNCSAVVAQTGGLPSGATFPVGTTTNIFTATDPCGNTVSCSFKVIISAGPEKPGNITGPNGVCQLQSGVVFCVPPVQGATSYQWTLPSGATAQGATTGTCITLKFSISFCGGQLCVKAKNSCGSSATTTLNLSAYTSVPSTPVAVTGPAQLCPNACATFSIAAVSKATSYEWTATTGLTITSGQGTNAVVVCASPSFTTGTLSVKAKNCKGSSGSRTKSLSTSGGAPVFCANTSDDNKTSGVCGGSTKSYAISAPSAISAASAVLVWTAPAGAIINDRKGHTGNSLTVTGPDPGGKFEVDVKFPANFTTGNVSVAVVGSCGNGPAATLAVKSVTSAPGTITGNSSVCKYSTKCYSISSVSGASSYTWAVTGGASIYSGQGSTYVCVKFNSASSNSATLSVKANNACGSSAVSSKNISVNLACRTSDNGIDNQVAELTSFVAFPNPSSGKTTISFISEGESDYYIRVFNMSGEVIIDDTHQSSIGINHKEINLEKFASGVYLIGLVNEEGETRTIRMILE